MIYKLVVYKYIRIMYTIYEQHMSYVCNVATYHPHMIYNLTCTKNNLHMQRTMIQVTVTYATYNLLMAYICNKQ
jgi:hypothetical protein